MGRNLPRSSIDCAGAKPGHDLLGRCSPQIAAKLCHGDVMGGARSDVAEAVHDPGRSIARRRVR
jgi:hypothetical protein